MIATVSSLAVVIEQNNNEKISKERLEAIKKELKAPTPDRMVEMMWGKNGNACIALNYGIPKEEVVRVLDSHGIPCEIVLDEHS